MDRNNPPIKALEIGEKSLSARRAWIEIKYVVKDSDFAGSLSARRAWIEIVRGTVTAYPVFPVALRKESVDRNIFACYTIDDERRSLSARRAWIEIGRTSTTGKPSPVALRKESVDRNYHQLTVDLVESSVALRKESVDRNILEVHKNGC